MRPLRTVRDFLHRVQGPGRSPTDVRQLLPGVAGLPALATALQSDDDQRLREVRAAFESLNGRIINSFVTSTMGACAVLVHPPFEIDDDGGIAAGTLPAPRWHTGP